MLLINGAPGMPESSVLEAPGMSTYLTFLFKYATPNIVTASRESHGAESGSSPILFA